jgi:serine/threonine protein kinase
VYRIVISDFGNCGFRCRRLKSMVGTEQYMSPCVWLSAGEVFADLFREMHNRNETHDHLVDMWGLGTIMLFLINGQELTAAKGLVNLTQAEVYAIILKVCLQSKTQPGKMAQDFARQCCQVTARNRMSAQEAQVHPWFSDPRHLKLIELVKKICKETWKPATGIFPPTDVLPDLAHLVTPSPEAETGTSECLSHVASGITASQYFSNVSMPPPSTVPTPPTPPGFPTGHSVPSSSMAWNAGVEVLCTPFNGKEAGAKASQSQGFRVSDVVRETQDIIYETQDIIPASISMEVRTEKARCESMYL